MTAPALVPAREKMRQYRLLAIVVVLFALSGCSLEPLANRLLAPPEATPNPQLASVPIQPLPTSTPVIIQARPFSVNVAKYSVQPGDGQEIDVTGTPGSFVNVVVTLTNGDHLDGGTHLGAQLDVDGQYVDQWTVSAQAPGGTATVLVQNVQSGQSDHETFLVDAPPWGFPTVSSTPPIVGYVPYGKPNAPFIAVTGPSGPTSTPLVVAVTTPVTATPTAPPTPTVSETMTPVSVATALALGSSALAGPLVVQASATPATVAPGKTVRITGVLADSAGHGVAGARLFAIAHFPSGPSAVWVSPAASGDNGVVWVEEPVTGATAATTITVDVYMTYAGHTYQGQTAFTVA